MDVITKDKDKQVDETLNDFLIAPDKAAFFAQILHDVFGAQDSQGPQYPQKRVIVR